MLYRNSTAIVLATLGVIAAASTALARPTVNQLFPSAVSDPSHESTVAGVADSRAIDDFILPTGNGRTHHVREIRLLMVSSTVPAPYNFGVTIFPSRYWTPPGRRPSEIATRLATSVIDRGAAPGGRMYEVRFLVPRTAIQLVPGVRYWISGFGISPTGRWSFVRKAGNVSGMVGRHNANYPYGGWWGLFEFDADFAFSVTTEQP